MDKLINNNPLSVWRILIVTASLFTLVPIVALVFSTMDIPVALAHQVFDLYGVQVKDDAFYLIPLFGLLFIFGQIQKQSMGEALGDNTGSLSKLTTSALSLINTISLLCIVISSVVIGLDVSVLEGLWLFLAAAIATGAGAAIKYALIDANHPSQPLMMILATLVTFLSSWIASNSTLSIFGMQIWSGYWAPAIGILVGLSMSNQSKVSSE